MKEEQHIQDFLNSGLLEQYVIGATDVVASQRVEQMIGDHEEIRFAYQMLQDDLRAYSQLHAVKPPADLQQDMEQRFSFTEQKPSQNRFNWLNIAAIIVALIALGGVWWSQNQVQALQQEVSSNENAKDVLMETLVAVEAEKEILTDELGFIKSTQTQRYVLEGNIKAQGLEVLAFYNPNQQKGLVSIEQMPALDDQHDYQLWADVEGEMISLAILKEAEKARLDPKILSQAESLNITIEKAGGSEHATVANLVAATPMKPAPKDGA